MDATLLTILVLLAIATLAAVVQARRRDACLRSFEKDAVTLALEGGELVWGEEKLYATGLELRYAAPVRAPGGHVERSFMFYKDEYPKIEALYRVPEGLSAEAQASRRREIARTAQPGPLRRLARRIRNWIALLRDALVQSVGLVVGLAKARRPGVANQEAGLQQLTSAVVGYAGTAYDPLLEAHLFRQVVVEVQRGGATHIYCGWLKNYTTDFLEIVDAFANHASTPDERRDCGAHALPPGLSVEVVAGKLRVRNDSLLLYYVWHAQAAGRLYPFACALPAGTLADLAVDVPEGADVTLTTGLVGRVDLVVPRTRALVRHAADGSEGQRRQQVGAEKEADRVRAFVPERAEAAA